MRQSEGTRANASFYYFFWSRERYDGTPGLISAAARTVLDVQRYNTGCLQKNGVVSKGNKEFISHLTPAQRTPSAAETVQVSHALPAVRFSCLMQGSGASFQDGVAAGKGFLCAPF